MKGTVVQIAMWRLNCFSPPCIDTFIIKLHHKRRRLSHANYFTINVISWPVAELHIYSSRFHPLSSSSLFHFSLCPPGTLTPQPAHMCTPSAPHCSELPLNSEFLK